MSSPPEASEVPGLSWHTRFALTMLGSCALPMTGLFTTIFAGLATTAFGGCAPAVPGCEWEMFAMRTPPASAILGLVVGCVAPWLPRSRPKPLWMLAGFGIQGLGVLLVFGLIAQIGH